MVPGSMSAEIAMGRSTQRIHSAGTAAGGSRGAETSICWRVKGHCSPRGPWDAYRGFGFADRACLDLCSNL